MSTFPGTELLHSEICLLYTCDEIKGAVKILLKQDIVGRSKPLDQAIATRTGVADTTNRVLSHKMSMNSL